MSSSVLGIDIAKATFHATLLVGERSADHEFSNSDKGFARLAAWLEKLDAGTLRACMEATGRYGFNLAAWLHTHGHKVSVVNPAVMHYYAKSRLHRNKTDKLDSATIAEFCQRENPRQWTPPPPEVAELQALCRHRSELIKQRDMNRNRLSADIPSAAVNELIREEIALLANLIKKVEERIRQHIHAHPNLLHEYRLLLSIPGIGPVGAALLVALQLKRFPKADAAVAFTGLNPRIIESGSSVRQRTRISKRGDSTLRRTLYLPAVNACQHNPIVKKLATRLAKAGKSSLVIIIAAMRKLICLAYGVLKSDRPFDPKYPRHTRATA